MDTHEATIITKATFIDIYLFSLENVTKMVTEKLERCKQSSGKDPLSSEYLHRLLFTEFCLCIFH